MGSSQHLFGGQLGAQEVSEFVWLVTRTQYVCVSSTSFLLRNRVLGH